VSPQSHAEMVFGTRAPVRLSAALQTFMELDTALATHKDVFAALNHYITAHNIRDPNNPAQLLLDSKLTALFDLTPNTVIDKFNLYWLLSPHLKNGHLVLAEEELKDSVALLAGLPALLYAPSRWDAQRLRVTGPTSALPTRPFIPSPGHKNHCPRVAFFFFFWRRVSFFYCYWSAGICGNRRGPVIVPVRLITRRHPCLAFSHASRFPCSVGIMFCSWWSSLTSGGGSWMTSASGKRADAMSRQPALSFSTSCRSPTWTKPMIRGFHGAMSIGDAPGKAFFDRLDEAYPAAVHARQEGEARVRRRHFWDVALLDLTCAHFFSVCVCVCRSENLLLLNSASI